MNRRLVLVILGVAVFIILGLNSTRLNRPPETGGDSAPGGVGAFLVYKKAAYLPFSVVANNLMKDDVAYFARHNYSVYSNPTSEVVFNIDNKPTLKGNAIILSGQYENTKYKISISLQKLNNDRVKTSITDKSNNINIDSKLPSATVFNKLIDQLPITADHYIIGYNSADSSITVTITDLGPEYLDQANAFLSQKLGVPVSDLTKYKIGYVYSTGVDYSDQLQRQ